MVWDQLEAMGAGRNSCAALALCKNKTKNKQEKTEGKKRKLFPEMDFPLGAGISVGIYLSIPLPGHGTWIGEHWKVE